MRPCSALRLLVVLLAAKISVLAATAPTRVAAQEPAWTVRALPDGARVAVAAGPPGVTEVAAFCLSETPFLAIRLEETAGDVVSVEFGFSQGSLVVEAPREPSAGGAYVTDLRETELAARLAGRDASVTLEIDGVRLGPLSLRGSSRAIQTALAPCPPA